MDSAEVRFLKINYDDLLAKLRQYASVKSKSHVTRAIILGGSLAKGTYTGSSDADLLVVADELPARSLERYTLYADASLSVDVEPRVYTTTELQNEIRQGDHFVIETITKGIPLFGAEFVEALRAEYKLR